MSDPRRLLAVAALLGAAGGVLAWLLITTADGSVRPWLVVALGVSAALLAAAVARVAELGRADPRPPRPAGPPVRRSDRERGGLARSEARLEQALRDPDRFEQHVRRRLRDLAEHRLRVKYGLDARLAPERAREIVGESLWQLMSSPVPTLPTRQQVQSWVTAVEQL